MIQTALAIIGGLAIGTICLTIFLLAFADRVPLRLDDEVTDKLPQEGELERSRDTDPKSMSARFRDGWKVEGHA